jgi:hypothetical protein
MAKVKKKAEAGTRWGESALLQRPTEALVVKIASPIRIHATSSMAVIADEAHINKSNNLQVSLDGREHGEC